MHLYSNDQLNIISIYFLFDLKLQHAMAQAANQLHQIQKKQQNHIRGNAGISGGILSSMMPAMKNRGDPFYMERVQPTKAQLTMPPSLQHNKMNSMSGVDVDKPGVSMGGPLPTSSPLSISPLGPIGGPPSLFGGLSDLSPPGCHVQVISQNI